MTNGWRSARSYSFLHFIGDCGCKKRRLFDKRRRYAVAARQKVSKDVAYLTGNVATPCMRPWS